MKKFTITLFAILITLLTNCQTVVIQINPGVEIKNAAPNQKKRYGTVGFGYIDITKDNDSACGQNVRKIVIERDWLDCIVHFFIGGLYTTRSVDVYCGD
jgi:hypothetical protein